MGMKEPKHEPQTQLAPNLVSGPKDTGSTLPQDNLASSAKVVDENVPNSMPANVKISHGTTTKSEGGK